MPDQTDLEKKPIRDSPMARQSRANRAEQRRRAAEKRVNMVDLELLGDEELLATDVPLQAKKAWAGSYLRLNEAILKPVKNYTDMFRQAQLCLAAIRHFEMRGMETLQIGRHADDSETVREVNRLRAEAVAAARARVKMEQEDVGRA